jgi:hypothetical protein
VSWPVDGLTMRSPGRSRPLLLDGSARSRACRMRQKLTMTLVGVPSSASSCYVVVREVRLMAHPRAESVAVGPTSGLAACALLARGTGTASPRSRFVVRDRSHAGCDQSSPVTPTGAAAGLTVAGESTCAADSCAAKRHVGGVRLVWTAPARGGLAVTRGRERRALAGRCWRACAGDFPGRVALAPALGSVRLDGALFSLSISRKLSLECVPSRLARTYLPADSSVLLRAYEWAEPLTVPEPAGAGRSSLSCGGRPRVRTFRDGFVAQASGGLVNGKVGGLRAGSRAFTCAARSRGGGGGPRVGVDR